MDLDVLKMLQIIHHVTNLVLFVEVIVRFIEGKMI